MHKHILGGVFFLICVCTGTYRLLGFCFCVYFVYVCVCVCCEGILAGSGGVFGDRVGSLHRPEVACQILVGVLSEGSDELFSVGCHDMSCHTVLGVCVCARECVCVCVCYDGMREIGRGSCREGV